MAATRKPRQVPSEGFITNESLEELRGQLSKDLGVDLLWGTDEEFVLRWLSTGIPSYDKALGGGIPFNRMALIIGNETAGKTTFVHLVLKAAQAAGISTAYVDAEHAWNPDWAQALGVDTSKLLVSRPVTGEKAYDTALALVRRKIGVIVIDSLASLTPDASLSEDIKEGEVFEKNNMGKTAQMNNRGVQGLINENRGSIILVINQLRESVGVTYGNPEVIPGGRAQRYYSSQTIRVKRGSWIEEGEDGKKKRVGYKMIIKLEKNKVGKPFEEAEASFFFTGEFDELASLIDNAIELGIITGKSPRWEIHPDGEAEPTKFYGRAKMLDAVRERPDLQDYLRMMVDQTEVEDV